MFYDPQVLTTLPPDAMRPLAHWFTSIGKMLIDAADAADKGKIEGAKLRSRRDSVFSAARMAAEYFYNGSSKDQALAITSKITGLEITALEVAWPRIKAELGREKRQQRDKRIVILAIKGLTHKQIGRRVGLAEKSVSRIISQERKAA